jgi:hypothetical protein
MGFLKDLKNGDIKSIIILVLIIFVFNLYWQISCIKSSTKSKEHMADLSSDIRQAVRQVYLADIQAIRNLSEVASKLQREGLTIAGDLRVSGKVIAGGEISNNSYSLSGLNTSIGNVKKTLDDTIQSLSKSFKSVSDALDKKYDKSGGKIDGNIEITKNVNITGHLTGTNFTMNTGGSNTIVTYPNHGQFIANGGIYFGAGACHGNGGRFGGCP